MTREDERWRMPGLERLGEQFRELEGSDPDPSRGRRHRIPTFARPAAALLATVALVAVALEVVSPAGALSPVNHAPAAAARSRFVRFSSSLDVSESGNASRRFTERGALDLATGDFDATLSPVGGARSIERRRVGDVFYTAATRLNGSARNARWHAIRLGRGGRSFAEGRAFSLIDPQIVFRVMSAARSPVSKLGQDTIAGTPTTHYRLSTSLAAFLTAERTRILNRSSYRTVDATLDVWLDLRGRPRRVQASFTAPRSRAESMTARIDFERYGAPVEVRTPARAVFSTRTASEQSGPLGGDPVAALQHALFAPR
jgi:hypothetical protein